MTRSSRGNGFGRNEADASAEAIALNKVDTNLEEA